MALTVKNQDLCEIAYNLYTPRLEKINTIIELIENNYKVKLAKTEVAKIDNFIKIFDSKYSSARKSKVKFEEKYSEWLQSKIELLTCNRGAPKKQYEDLGSRAKKIRLSESLSTRSDKEVQDMFQEILARGNQPKEAKIIADILPNASPLRLKRIVKSIPTPTSSSEFSEEEAIALMFELGLSRNKYLILRNALIAKGHDILPSYFAVLEKKKV